MSFPELIKQLPAYKGVFEAHRVVGEDADVFFASYPAGSAIDAHTHDTQNVGLVVTGALFMDKEGVETCYGQGEWYHIDKNQRHSARFEEDTSIIECWVKG